MTILAVLFVVAIGSVVVHALFLRQDRVGLIDQLARETATSLIKAKANDIRKINFSDSEKIVTDELGKTDIQKFFIIWDAKGEVLYESAMAKKLLKITDLPTDDQWRTLYINNKYVRILNLNLPEIPNRMLQVGIVINQEFVKPDYFSKSSITFLSCIVALGLVASFLLTSFLLQPLVRLERFLAKLADQAKTQPQLETVPETLLGKSRHKDEFQRMVLGLNSLIQRVNNNYRFSRLWAYQMAHELKTPLSILNIELEQIRAKADMSDHDMLPLRNETDKLSHTISSFLDWAELENTSEQKHLFVNHLQSVVRSVGERLAGSYPNRIQFDCYSNPTVLANQQHLEQLVANLVANALVYSRGAVTLTVIDQSLAVRDRGPGIPSVVMDRLGEPFNRGESKIKGHGLGLAWVKSVCRFYGWELDVSTNSGGTEIRVTFPSASQSA